MPFYAVKHGAYSSEKTEHQGENTMKLRKIAAALVSAAMVAALAGCSTGKTSGSGAASGSDASDGEGKVYKVGICQLVEHPALDAATQGFKDALVEKLGEDGVKFDEGNAQNENTNCTTICTGFVASNVDLIMANATAALQAAASATDTAGGKQIPVLGTSVTDYGTALDIKDFSGKTGFNVSGTSDLAPIDQQEDMLVELVPDAKMVGILYCSAEANSKYQAQLFEAELEKDGIAYKEYSAADTNEIRTVVTTAVSECDAIYIPTDNTMASNTEVVRNAVVPAGIPVIAGEQGICSGCGVATLSISYYDLGYTTGEMAYEILVNGADPAEMDVRFAPKAEKLYNADICAELGITIPEGYTAIATE